VDLASLAIDEFELPFALDALAVDDQLGVGFDVQVPELPLKLEGLQLHRVNYCTALHLTPLSSIAIATANAFQDSEPAVRASNGLTDALLVLVGDRLQLPELQTFAHLHVILLILHCQLQIALLAWVCKACTLANFTGLRFVGIFFRLECR